MKTVSSDVMSLFQALMQDLNTPVSLGMYLRGKYQEWTDFKEKQVSPHDYLDCPTGIERFRRDYQAVSFLRKFEALPVTEDLEEKAIASFYAYERQCYITNQRIDLVLNHTDYRCEFERSAKDLADIAKRLIARWLGPIPRQLFFRHGPGSTYEAPKSSRAYTLGDKYNAPFTSTARASYLVDHLVWRSHETWVTNVCAVHSHPWQITKGNRFTTVPKDSRSLRGICIEPGMNIYLQLGVGAAISHRLSRLGLDIGTGQERHGARVRQASVDASDATIDLSGASDTVAFEVVRYLLPPEWFELLADLRSPMTYIQGRWLKLEKFSSMGNGFTFELETLLFLAICCAATGLEPGEVMVYGDDIIVPRECSRETLAALRFFGFTPNVKKTFTSGMFLESCGSDFFNGEAVRPYFMKKDPNAPERWIGVCNGLTRRYKRAWTLAHAKIPKAARCYGPCDLGDIIIHTDDIRRWTFKWRNSIRWFRVYRPVAKRPIPLSRFGSRSHLLLALSGVSSTGVVPRDWVLGYKTGWVARS